MIEVLVVIVIISIIAGLVIPACNSKPPAPPNYVTAHSPVTIDGCQYLMVKISSSDGILAHEFLSLVHKGNCTNHTALKAEE